VVWTSRSSFFSFARMRHVVAQAQVSCNLGELTTASRRAS